jgi:U4/U6 small nuclear ribonucleoprotein PRP4
MLQIGEVQGAYYTLLLFACHGRAQKRIAQQRTDSIMDLGRIVDIRKKVFTEVKVRLSFSFSPLCRTCSHRIKKFANLGSQIGDDRPIAQVRFAPNNKILATGSWSGTVKLWNVPACTPIRSLRGTWHCLITCTP